MAIMAAAKGKELWDRLENEPERLYRAFESYLTLSSGDRAILEACRGHVGNPEAAKPSDTWSGRSRQYAWREREAGRGVRFAASVAPEQPTPRFRSAVKAYRD